MNYCEYCSRPDVNELHIEYHNRLYGFPVESDDELFGRLLLEINQAGLSWELMLKKKKNFERAYDHFSIRKVAEYTEKDHERLMNDASIIRNRLKINAAIFNANQILHIQREFGSFISWMDDHHPKELKDWIKLFKKHFKFVGGEIVREFLVSTGYLVGAHEKNCPIFAKILEKNPKWTDYE